MIRFKRVVWLAVVVLFLGCAAVSEDLRLSNLGFNELSNGNYVQAEKYLNEALAVNRFNPYAILNLGVVYQNTGRIEKAREAYNNVITLQPQETAAVSNEESNAGKPLVDLAKENLNKLQR
jgi:Flp pilus assembly protein TadD